MIHPHLPVRIPCYDLTLIAEFTLVPAAAGPLGTLNFADLTGSVCKRRERIHRNLLICDYYQFRVHAGEFQPAIPTEESFEGLAPPCGLATRCTFHCRMCVALDISIMMT